MTPLICIGLFVLLLVLMLVLSFLDMDLAACWIAVFLMVVIFAAMGWCCVHMFRKSDAPAFHTEGAA